MNKDHDKLQTRNWKEWQCNGCAIKLAWAGVGGVDLLKQLLVGGQLKTEKWNKEQCCLFAAELAGAGKDG
jgi:hypothetical protein